MAVFVHAQDIKLPPSPHPYLLTMFDNFYHAYDVLLFLGQFGPPKYLPTSLMDVPK